MKRVLLAFMLASIVLLTGCDPAPKVALDKSSIYSIPPELGNCKVYLLRTPEADPNLYVVVCDRMPLTTTNLVKQEGKIRKQYVIVNGVRYEEVKP